jgi:hypothetical protein
MTGKTLIAYSTKSGINADAAHAIADALEKNYNMDITVADLKDGTPDIGPFQNIVVGGGVKGTSVYSEAVDFLEKNFEDRSVALYFCCEDEENPKTQSTENNTKELMAKNKSLKPIDVAAFGGCVIKQGRSVMDTLNMNRLTEWAMELGKKFNPQPQSLQQAATSSDTAGAVIALEPMPPAEPTPAVEKTPEPMPPAEPTPAVEKTPEPMPPAEVMPAVEMPAMEKETEGLFEIMCDSADKFRFHLKAANGEIIAASQSYGAKESALKGIASIKKNASIAKIVDLAAAGGAMPEATHAAGIVQDPVFEIMCDVGGKFRFHLKAPNGQIIAASQSYGTLASAEKGIASIKKNAAMARVVDHTIVAT